MEVCRSNNTIGWFIAIYGYKSCLLIMGAYMAWETRHVKVQILNDSQYIGTCVYCAVSCSIIVVLSNIVKNYVLCSYLATTLSIIGTTTITLFLLFIPKIRAILRRVDIEDPVMQSMGLKIECNTRRLVTNDTKELLYRMEIQNKVYRAELDALDREIARLEALLIQYPSSSINSNPHLCEPYVISNSALDQVSFQSTINRASWPNYKNTLTIPSRFLSERKLTKNSNETFFNKLKRFFGSIPSVWINAVSDTEVDLSNNKKEIVYSNRHCYKKSASSYKKEMQRINSTLSVNELGSA